MAVVAKQSNQRCKLCKSPRRGEIDALLELRSRGEKVADGRRATLDVVRELLASEFGVENPTVENVKGHWSRHCEVVSVSEIQSAQDAVAEACRMLAERYGGVLPNADEYPDLVIEIDGLAKVIQLSKGELPRVTTDQALKAIDTKTRRRQNERISDLLDLASDAITGSLGLAAPQGELVEGEAAELEAEIVDVE